MKLTTKSRYSLLALIYIARHEEEGFIKIGDICSEYHVSQKYLERLLVVLREKNYIVTKRGIGGGCCLAKPAKKITAAEIIRLMDGALAPVKSVSEYFYVASEIEKEKKLLKVFKEIRDFVSDKMENLTIQDLL
jgi:Rrf2 family transcriptional regulator, cysteine metabolism repressor